MLKKKVLDTAVKVMSFVNAIAIGLYIGAANVYANNPPAASGIPNNKYTFSTGLDFGDMTNKILNILFAIVRIVGAAWAVMGVVKIVSSFKDDRPEDMKGGVASTVAGFMLVIAPWVLQALGIFTVK